MLWCLNRGSKMGIPIKVYLSFNLASSAPFRGHLPLTLSLASLCHTNAPYHLHYLCSLHMYISICVLLIHNHVFSDHSSSFQNISPPLSFFLLSISVKQRRLLPHTRYILVLCYSNVTRTIIHLQHLRLSTLFLAWSLRKNSHITHLLSACQSEQFSGWPVLYSFLQHCWIMHFHLLLCISIQRCISSFFPLSELESVNYIQRGVFLSPGLNDNTLTHTSYQSVCSSTSCPEHQNAKSAMLQLV